MHAWLTIAFLMVTAACAGARPENRQGYVDGFDAAAVGIARLLPAGPDVRPWTPTDRRLSYDASTLSDFIDGGAEAFLDYGFSRAVSLEYVGGGESVVCAVYEMRDPEAAFGIFSTLRSSRKQQLPIGDDAVRSDAQLAFWQSRYYVTLETYTPRGGGDKALETFARAISGRIGARAGLPGVMSRLPRQSLQPMTARLLKGRAAANAVAGLTAGGGAPLLGVEDLVLTGDYQNGAGSYRLMLLLAGNTQRVEQLRALPERLFTKPAGYARAVIDPRPSPGLVIWRRDGRAFASQPIDGGVRLVVDATRVEDARAGLASTPQ